MKKFFKNTWTVTVPMLLIMYGGPTLFLLRVVDIHGLWFIMVIGTLVVMLANLVHIVIVDSRKQWPELSWQARSARVAHIKR
jgi:uncharacterized membrane protein